MLAKPHKKRITHFRADAWSDRWTDGIQSPCLLTKNRKKEKKMIKKKRKKLKTEEKKIFFGTFELRYFGYKKLICILKSLSLTQTKGRYTKFLYANITDNSIKEMGRINPNLK